MFLTLPDYQHTIYYLGIPYTVESNYGGRFMFVLDIYDNCVEDELRCKILIKHEKWMNHNKHQHE